MKSQFTLLILWMFSAPLFAFDRMNFVDASQQHCFAKAMVGMDSVINASMGVPPEHAVEIVASPGNHIKILDNPGSVDMLKVILDAYLWQESPHSYAISVFYQCAQENVLRRQTAVNDTEETPN